MTVTSPPIGAIAYGSSGVPCKVIDAHSDSLTLEKPDRSLIQVRPAAIVRWELPPPPQAEAPQELPQKLEPVPFQLTPQVINEQRPDFHKPHPGSIATPVTERVEDVLKHSAPKRWTVQAIAKLPYMGGASIEQIKAACWRLMDQGVVVQDMDSKDPGYRWKN